MATPAQIAANRLNAQESTGPKTAAGKAAVAQNSMTHGLSSRNFALLPGEDPAAFDQLLSGLTQEHQPGTATESFLVLELARAQWKIERICAIEAQLLSSDGATEWAGIAAHFRQDSSLEQALARLNRYEQAARRAWHQALNQLLKVRASDCASELRRAKARRIDSETLINAIVGAPPPTDRPETTEYETKPMPVHLQRELDAHKRRDPLFDPRHDRSQMSKELQKYLEKQGL